MLDGDHDKARADGHHGDRDFERYVLAPWHERLSVHRLSPFALAREQPLNVLLQSQCWGLCRNDDREPWESAFFEFGDEWLDVHPSADAATSAGRPVRVRLAEIANIAQLDQDEAGRVTMQLTTIDDAGFDAILDPGFVESLCSALRATTHSTPEPRAGTDDSVVISLTTTPAGPARPVLTVRPAWTRRRIAVAVVAAAAVAAIAGVAVHNWNVASKQTEQAERFKESLEAANTSLSDTERLLASVQGELVSTSDERDRKTELLSAAETENTNLQARISELSNEKAEAQDQRNFAAEQARIGAQAGALMLQCRDLILDALSYSLDEYYYSASATLDQAVPICQQANTLVAELVAATGG